ncbi:MAG TPA: SDR family oxidoreductase, partial [Pirellulaceae bacterium]|nr:SDR family oxidoreductase [Pirellulaceae bacterium]
MSYWQRKVALVTGGSAGLGFVIAETLCNRGASVMLAARDGQRLQEAVGRLQERGFRASGFATDVTDAEQVNSLMARTIEEFGRLDILVNNVGRSTRGNVLDTSPEEFRDLMELNFLSVVRCTQAAAPHLIESHGHLVNIGSLASKSVSKFLGAYPASKFALAAYSQQLRFELNPQGVHVLLVCPGPIARKDAGQRYDVE